MPATVPQLLDLLRASHDRLVVALSALDEPALGGPSYHDWTIAQVASHLGSGAEVFGRYLDAGQAGRPAPGREDLQRIWARWDLMGPADQARGYVTADAGLLDTVEALSPEERDRWRLDLFGAQRDLAGLLELRLAEHALHAWDVLVALDPSATIAESDVTVVLDYLPQIAAWTGRPAEPAVVDVRTTGPSGRFTVALGERATLVAGVPEAPTATLTLSAEALVRLVYGRLDADHTPASTSASGVDLDTVRAAFPGP